jgi:epoxyqueuosine reductase QueG
VGISRGEFADYLVKNGASQVGFADVSGVSTNNMESGVAILLSIPKDVVRSMYDGPNIEYFNQYNALNNKLDHLAELGAQFIRARGYDAVAQATYFVKEFGNYRTEIPHKTVATLAGLGWIGRSALFVTKKYGSAIRLTSIITNMELDYGVPITKSICGDCNRCVKACPGKAISGKLWDIDTDRDELFDPIKCRKKARQLAKERINKEITLCGKCIEVCPYTQAYINSNDEEGGAQYWY